MIYDNLKKNLNNKTEPKNVLYVNFINGAFAEIKGPIDEEYDVKFINKKTGKIHYQTTISNNMWTRCSIQYFVEWRIEVYNKGVLWASHDYNAEGKRVYIALDSKALGDTLAWVGYGEEFAKKHKCKVILSTFHNKMFQNEYPNIEFIEPGESADNIYGMYGIGFYYDEDGNVNTFRNVSDPKGVPLQQTASDILGLGYKEVKPRITLPKVKKDDKLITIAIHGTAQSKYWNNKEGWQGLVNLLKGKGYKVKLVSREKDNYMGNKHPLGIEQLPEGPLEKVIEEMLKSKLFIGIGSGLSWLSWALGTKTVLISGFSYDWAEMKDCIRITAQKGKCEGCFNRVRLEPGDWNWCPDHKGTDRQFECTKSITSQMVIDKIQDLL